MMAEGILLSLLPAEAVELGAPGATNPSTTWLWPKNSTESLPWGTLEWEFFFLCFGRKACLNLTSGGRYAEQEALCTASRLRASTAEQSFNIKITYPANFSSRFTAQYEFLKGDLNHCAILSRLLLSLITFLRKSPFTLQERSSFGKKLQCCAFSLALSTFQLVKNKQNQNPSNTTPTPCPPSSPPGFFSVFGILSGLL